MWWRTGATVAGEAGVVVVQWQGYPTTSPETSLTPGGGGAPATHSVAECSVLRFSCAPETTKTHSVPALAYCLLLAGFWRSTSATAWARGAGISSLVM